jgi:hypothetical protein
MLQDDFLQFPLSVGKKYSVKETYASGFNKFDVEVVAFEKIKVEAGEFEAFWVKYSGFWAGTSGEASGYSGQVGLTQYYAPAAKRVIKRSFFTRLTNGSLWAQSSSELVKWEPKAALPPEFANATSMPAKTASAPWRLAWFGWRMGFCGFRRPM